MKTMTDNLILLTFLVLILKHYLKYPTDASHISLVKLIVGIGKTEAASSIFDQFRMDAQRIIGFSGENHI